MILCLNVYYVLVFFYMIQSSGPPGIGLRPLNSPSSVSGIGSYEQVLQQYQQHQNQSQFRLQPISPVGQPFRDQGVKPIQAAQAASDQFGLRGLLSVIRMSDPDLTSLALGIDLTTLGLNLNSAENLHKMFGSPWSDEPAKGDPEFTVPQCYHAKNPPPLSVSLFVVLIVVCFRFLAIFFFLKCVVLAAASILLKVPIRHIVLYFL